MKKDSEEIDKLSRITPYVTGAIIAGAAFGTILVFRLMGSQIENNRREFQKALNACQPENIELYSMEKGEGLLNIYNKKKEQFIWAFNETMKKPTCKQYEKHFAGPKDWTLNEIKKLNKDYNPNYRTDNLVRIPSPVKRNLPRNNLR